jgi:hypothetical protein
MKVLHVVAAAVLLCSCASPESARISYRQVGTDMVATLSDGTELRAPCMLATTREVTRIGKDVDYCELAPENRLYILERQREITEREQQAAAAP